MNEVVFYRSGAGAKRTGIYRRMPIGPDRNKDRLVARVSGVRGTDTEDGNLTFETRKGIYVTRESSRRPRLVASTRTDRNGNRTVVKSASLSGGYVYYLRYDSDVEQQHSVARQLVSGTAVGSQRTAGLADARQLAIGGPRLLFTRSGQPGLYEISAPQFTDARD